MVFSSIQSAYNAMRANKIRTALTVLGMVIGIASVIIVYSAGYGIERLVLDQVESFGTNIIQTEIKLPTNKKVSNTSAAGAGDLVQGVQVSTLTLADMNDIKKLANVKDAYAGIMSQEAVSYGGAQKKAFIFGTSASYIDIDRSEIDIGRFFSEEEDRGLAQVAVIGFKVKEKLFGDLDPLGKMIQIRKTKFRVIGVMAERGAVMGMDFDDYIYLPVRSLQKRIMGIDYLMYFLSEVHDMNRAEETAADMRAILRDNHNIRVNDPDDFHKDDFRVATMTEMMDMLDTITGAITLLLLAIVAISLVVGGVGILNIMYVAVSERTAEIGLRKAVGARRRDIMRQFLIESLMITLAGGVIGILLGGVLSYLVAYGAAYGGLDWEFSIPIKAYVVAFGFSAFFGLSFGLFPAWKAARLEPAEALRAE